MIITSETNIDIDHDFKIEAGPGAGKTQFLVGHINNVLRNSDKLLCTRKIACITYTNAAVETILKRLGKGATNKVEVSTIHSFLYNNIVKPYCSFIPTEYGLCVSRIKGHDKISISRSRINLWINSNDIFNTLETPNNKNQLLRNQDQIKALIGWLNSVRCSISNDQIKFIGDSKKAIVIKEEKGKKRTIKIKDKNLNLLQEYLLEYKKLYWCNGKLDHEDVLFFSYLLLHKYPFILTVLRAKFPYFFIDEFQDTNPIQAFIINEVRKRESVVGVIGDKAQAIYGFQGAEVSLFNNFRVDSINSHTIHENHRSSNQIVDFLNIIRKDITQKPCGKINDENIVILVGDRISAYSRAKIICNGKTLISLSRDNFISNTMKHEIDGDVRNDKLLERFKEKDSSNRGKYIVAFIEAIELAKNTKYKEAVKKINWIFSSKDESKKLAFSALIVMFKQYDKYYNASLMDFYNVLINSVSIKIPKFNDGPSKVKSEYENNLYKNMALYVDIIDDTSNHITIHKAKGAEYENVFVIGNKDMLDLLLKTDIENNDEHRVYYVAMSRARRNLFLQLDSLTVKDEKKIKKMYNINIERIDKNFPC